MRGESDFARGTPDHQWNISTSPTASTAANTSAVRSRLRSWMDASTQSALATIANSGMAAYWRIDTATKPEAMLAARNGIDIGRRRKATPANARASIWNAKAGTSVMNVGASGPQSGHAAIVTASSA